MHCLYWVLGALVVGIGGGGYLHYRFGAEVYARGVQFIDNVRKL